MDKFSKVLVKSPLNCTGGKFQLLEQLLPLFPEGVDNFVDLFCGCCNVGANVYADSILCVDKLWPLIRFFRALVMNDKAHIFATIDEIIDEYGFSKSCVKGYEYYNSTSTEGLATYNSDKFLKLRDDYNNRDEDSFYYDMVFYTIAIFSFNNQISFNRRGKCDIPVGKRDFNMSLQEKLSIFIDRINSREIVFMQDDFRNIEFIKYKRGKTLVYADPPYLITTATRNQRGGWNESKEQDLFRYLDDLDDRNISFALSNVLESNGRTNDALIEWSKRYTVHNLNFNYKDSSYQKESDNEQEGTAEVLITNY